MISARTKETILSTSRIEEVIGEFVNLKKRGTNFVGLCPFHNEKTPSFNVSPSKGIFKCFGCGKAGDVVTFLMEHEKFSYPEALTWLAQRYNIPIEETVQSAEEQTAEMERESLFIVNQFAQEHFHHNLFKDEEGKTIGYTYFMERGLTDEVIRKFFLGYALKNNESLVSSALKKGYKLELLKNAGLVVTKGDKELDFFHERIIFPIHNLSGKTVAFGGRVLGKNEKGPKYINSPETEIYHKSQLVYGIFQARNEIRKLDECFLCEGYMDVIAMHQAGLGNCVASSGTSLTEDQIKLIKRFTSNITILYDGDAAGIQAALRGMDMMIRHDLNIRIVVLPDSEDPDSYLRKHGATALQGFISKNKKVFLSFKIEYLLGASENDVLKKSGVIHEVVETLAIIPDTVKRALLTKEAARLLLTDEEVLIIEVNKVRRKQLMQQTPVESFEAEALQPQIKHPTERSEDNEPDEYQERDVIRLLLEYGSLPMSEDETVASFIFSQLEDITFDRLAYRLMLHEIQDDMKMA